MIPVDEPMWYGCRSGRGVLVRETPIEGVADGDQGEATFGAKELRGHIVIGVRGQGEVGVDEVLNVMVCVFLLCVK